MRKKEEKGEFEKSQEEVVYLERKLLEELKGRGELKRKLSEEYMIVLDRDF